MEAAQTKYEVSFDHFSQFMQLAIMSIEPSISQSRYLPQDECLFIPLIPHYPPVVS